MSSSPAISVRDLSKCFRIYEKPLDRLLAIAGAWRGPRFQEFWALRGVSFDVQKGETIGVIGRNGSGKSTLLQLVCGTLTPTGGSVEVAGRLGALLELGAGFNLEFTGRENVYLSAAIQGLSRREIDARFEEVAAFADIGDFIDRPMKTYSSGMCVRVAFAIQASSQPEVLVVDEALAVGDESFQRKCFARFEQLKERGSAILLVSHSPELIISLCDRVLLLDHGRTLLLADPPGTVRAYHHLIFAPKAEQEQIAAEIIAQGAAREQAQSPAIRSETDAPASGTPEGIELRAFLDPSLLPETTLAYAVQGAEIEELAIQEPGGRRVNVLIPGAEYEFVSRGRFHRQVRRVYFGIHIRSVTGTVVTGQRYPGIGRFIDVVEEGARFDITFKFRMLLVPGGYFVGGGVWSLDEPYCLHRIMDKLMFKVLPRESETSFGIFDAARIPPVLSLA